MKHSEPRERKNARKKTIYVQMAWNVGEQQQHQQHTLIEHQYELLSPLNFAAHIMRSQNGYDYTQCVNGDFGAVPMQCQRRKGSQTKTPNLLIQNIDFLFTQFKKIDIRSINKRLNPQNASARRICFFMNFERIFVFSTICGCFGATVGLVL